MTDDTVACAETAAEERGSTRKTRDVRGVTALEEQRLRRDSVQMGTHRTAVAVAPKVIGAERVDVDVDQAHRSKNASTLCVLLSVRRTCAVFRTNQQKHPELTWILLRRNTWVSDISAHAR